MKITICFLIILLSCMPVMPVFAEPCDSYSDNASDAFCKSEIPSLLYNDVILNWVNIPECRFVIEVAFRSTKGNLTNKDYVDIQNCTRNIDQIRNAIKEKNKLQGLKDELKTLIETKGGDIKQ